MAAKTKKAAKKTAKATTDGAVSIDKAKYGYEAVTREVEGGKKRKSYDNADNVAKALRNKTDAEVEKIAKDNELGDKFKSLSHLNPGMRRMSIGNTLRGIIRKGGKVKVDNKNVASL